MAVCDMCGNDYEGAFEITMNGETHTFDSFECAIAMVAPTCAHCNCRIIGHGVQANGVIYCCAHCAKHSGEKRLVDNAQHAGARGS